MKKISEPAETKILQACPLPASFDVDVDVFAIQHQCTCFLLGFECLWVHKEYITTINNHQLIFLCAFIYPIESASRMLQLPTMIMVGRALIVEKGLSYICQTMPTMRKTKLGTLRKCFWFLLVVNLIFIIWSKNFLLPLSSGDILRYETARTLANAQTIVAEWQLIPGKMSKAIQSIKVDYIFIVLYVSLLGMGCLYLARISRQHVLQKAGNVFAILIIGAGICDVVENLAMMDSLTGSMTGFNVRLAYDMAVAKFSVLILSILFLTICFIFRFLNKAEEKYQSHGIYQ